MPRPVWHKPRPISIQAPVDVLELPPGNDPQKLKTWFKLLPANASEMRRILFDSEWKIRRHARSSVTAAAGAGALEALCWMEEIGISPTIGGGPAVRAASKGGHLGVLRWLRDRGLQPAEGLRWACRIAAQNGHVDTLQWLWSHGLSDQFRAAGCLVRGAAQGGRLDVMRWIEDHGLLVVEGGMWSTRLAAQAGDVRVVQWLFEHGMTMEEHGEAALRGAVAGGHLEVLRWILKQPSAPKVTEHGCSLVWAACEGGHLEVLEALHRKGVSARQGGGAAVWAAARGGHLHVLQWLDANGVPPSEGGSAVVRAAVKGGYLKILRWLVENGVDVRDGGNFCGPQTAAERGHLYVLQWLVLQGMDLEKFGRSLILGAAKGGQIEVLRWLHSQQVAINTFAKTAVQEASAGGHKAVLQWLLENRTNLSEGGWEAMQAASTGGHLELLRWLSENGLSIKEHGHAAVIGAAKGGHVEVLRWLKGAGVDFWRCNGQAVQEAAGFGHVEVLQWLHQQGLEIKDGGGSAVIRAAEGGHLEALRFLVEHGIKLQDHWYAAVWAASEAVQPDVHHWLLERETQEANASQRHSRRTSRVKTPRVMSMPLAKGVTMGRLTSNRQDSKSRASGRPPTPPRRKRRGSFSKTAGAAAEDGSLKWMLHYTLDESEEIYDELQRMAACGHMEILDWIATITEPRWTVKMAVQGGHLGALQWLVRYGLDIKSVEEFAVRWAAEAGHVDMLRWFSTLGMKLGSGTVEAAASRGTAVVLDVLRDFQLPLSQHPWLAEELVPFLSRVTPTLLANFILVPCSAAEGALESVLAEAKVVDHRGRLISRACMTSRLSARTFLWEPGCHELRRTLAPFPGKSSRVQAESVPVKISRVTVPGAISPVVLRALAVTPRLQVCQSLAAQAIVLAAWAKVRRVYLVDVFLEMVQLVAVIHMTFLTRPLADEQSEYEKTIPLSEDDSMATAVTMWLLFAIWSKGVVRGVQRIRVYCQCGWGRDLFNLEEVWEWSCLLIMALFLCTVFLGVSTFCEGYLLSLLGFTRWWTILYSLRGFDYFGSRIQPILGALLEILPFGFVMIFYGGALVHALFALSYHPEWDVFLSSYRVGMTGEMDLEDSLWGTAASSAPVWWRLLQQVWFIAGLFLFTVALMNIFIAIMSAAFDRRDMRADADFLRARAKICLGYAITYEAYASIRSRICKFFCPLASPPLHFSEECEVVWLCHREGSRCELAAARSLREMIAFASELLLTETDSRLQLHEQQLRAALAEQLRTHNMGCSTEVVIGSPVQLGTVVEKPAAKESYRIASYEL